MPTIKELQTRIEQANRLLKKDLLPKDWLRIAAMRLGDQKRLAIRQRFPELDHSTRMQ